MMTQRKNAKTLTKEYFENETVFEKKPLFLYNLKRNLTKNFNPNHYANIFFHL